jgi:menaquinol-cytochrome c reductase iron-sulfur subunit
MSESTHSPCPNPPPTPHRRSALMWLTAGLGALATAAVGLPVVGYIFGFFLKPADERADRWIDLAPADSFRLNATKLVTYDNPHQEPWDGMTGKNACYVRRQDENQFLVLAVNCAHLGCPVTWFAQSGLFMCPCHGGVYYEDGSHASGPPPRGLYRHEWRIVEGRLQILAGHLPTLHDPLDPKDKGRSGERGA